MDTGFEARFARTKNLTQVDYEWEQRLTRNLAEKERDIPIPYHRCNHLGNV
jgi:hypothetical protein